MKKIISPKFPILLSYESKAIENVEFNILGRMDKICANGYIVHPLGLIRNDFRYIHDIDYGYVKNNTWFVKEDDMFMLDGRRCKRTISPEMFFLESGYMIPMQKISVGDEYTISYGNILGRERKYIKANIDDPYLEWTSNKSEALFKVIEKYRNNYLEVPNNFSIYNSETRLIKMVKIKTIK